MVDAYVTSRRMPAMIVGERSAGNPHAAFDERGGETDRTCGTAPLLDSTTGEGWSTAWGANRRGMARTDERTSVARVGSRMSNTASPAALLGCMLTVRCLVRVRWQHVAIAHERG